MNHQELEIIRSNWEAIRPNVRIAVRLFYTKALLIDPSLAPLFRRNAEEQTQQVLRAVGMTIHGLSQPRILQPLLRMLGHQAAVKRMQASQFESIGQAMLWALGIVLGTLCDDVSRRAWLNLYRMVSGTLLDAAGDSRVKVVSELRAAA